MINIPCVFLLGTYELLLHKCKLNILTYDVYVYLTNLLEKICVFLKKCRTASGRTRGNLCARHAACRYEPIFPFTII